MTELEELKVFLDNNYHIGATWRNQFEIWRKQPFRGQDTVKYLPSGYVFVVHEVNEVNARDNQGHWYEVDKLELVKR